MYTFNTWHLNVTLTLLIATQLLRSAHCLIMGITCAKLFQNKFQWFKKDEADMKWRLFNTWPYSVTLTLAIATQLLCYAHRLRMEITCAKNFFKKISGLKVIERTWILLCRRGLKCIFKLKLELISIFKLTLLYWPFLQLQLVLDKNKYKLHKLLMS
jgi:hypothetical protein